MTLKQKAHLRIECLEEEQLNALMPLLGILTDTDGTIETDLTEEEKEIIRQSREDLDNGVQYIPLEDVFVEYMQEIGYKLEKVADRE